MSATPPDSLRTLVRLAVEAGAVVMRHYAQGCVVRTKSDNSPVTAADEEAERLILMGLAADYVGVPVVAEEAMAAARVVSAAARFFLVDPLDGTQEFVSGNGEFTVNIAEIVNGLPVAGVVYAPAKRRLFAGMTGRGAFETGPELSHFRSIAARTAPQEGLVAIGSRSHNDDATAEFLKQFSIRKAMSAGSSLKFCLIAAGEADIYARGGRTMEWDTAAGHAVLAAAGGQVTRWDGGALAYGKPGFENPPFVARGRA